MHSRGRGNSGSKKPLVQAKPTWTRYDGKEVELLVGKLSKEGKSTSEIGMMLRDSYGVPSVKLMTGKRIQKVIAEKNQMPEMPEDILSLMKRSVIIRKHIEANKQDMTALRGLQLTESKVKRLAKYYKRTGRIAQNWKYNPSAVKIYME